MLHIAVFSFATASPVDHSARNTSLTIGRCSRRECTNITVYSDQSLEHHETFSISLEHLPGHDDRILLTDTEKHVTVYDNDCKCNPLPRVVLLLLTLLLQMLP